MSPNDDCGTPEKHEWLNVSHSSQYIQLQVHIAEILVKALTTLQQGAKTSLYKMEHSLLA